MAERNLSYREALDEGLVVPSAKSKLAVAILKEFMSQANVNRTIAERSILKPESWWNARFASDLKNNSIGPEYLERAKSQLKAQYEKAQREKSSANVAEQRLSRVTGGLIGGEAGGAASSPASGSLPALGVSGSGGLADETMLSFRKKLK